LYLPRSRARIRPAVARGAGVVAVGVVVVMASSGGGAWWLGDRDTFKATPAPTACMDSFGRRWKDGLIRGRVCASSTRREFAWVAWPFPEGVLENRNAPGSGMMAIKILIVDDEPDLELLICQRFRRQIREKVYVFEFAHNGLEALHRFQSDAE